MPVWGRRFDAILISPHTAGESYQEDNSPRDALMIDPIRHMGFTDVPPNSNIARLHCIVRKDFADVPTFRV